MDHIGLDFVKLKTLCSTGRHGEQEKTAHRREKIPANPIASKRHLKYKKASKIAQLVNMPTVKPGNLGSIARTHLVEGQS